MRLLFISNLFPPLSEGGYEQWCCEIALRLRASGHDVQVLTSNHRAAEADAAEAGWVERKLHLEMALLGSNNATRFFFGRNQRRNQNQQTLRATVARLQPDAIIIWGLWNIDSSLAQLAEKLLPQRVVYYFGDYWPTLPPQDLVFWQVNAQSSLRALPKKLLGAIAQQRVSHDETPQLVYQHALFCSAALQDELTKTVQPQHAAVVAGGVEIEPYLSVEHVPSERLRLLYVGRFSAEKGIPTLIAALQKIEHAHPNLMLDLQLAGGGNVYEERTLQAQLATLKTPVKLLGRVAASNMPQVYANADVLIFPSLWAEPFGRVLVEAMAAGLPIIGTPRGGAADLLTHEHNALVFAPNDSAQLAKHIVRLAQDGDFGRKLAQAGRQRATQYDLKHMAIAIETYLAANVTAPSASFKIEQSIPARKQLLFISTWVPYPADNGSRLRVYNLLKGIAQQHDITLLALSDGGNEDEARAHLSQFCRAVEFAPSGQFRPKRLRSKLALLHPRPRSLLDLYQLQTATIIRQLIEAQQFDLIIASQQKVALYHQSFGDVPAIYEEVENALNLDYRQADSRLDRLRGELTWLKTRSWQRSMLQHFDAATVVSQPEHDLFRRYLSRDLPLHVVPNGVDVTSYHRVSAAPQPQTLIFTGAFSYDVNYHAMCWFLEQVYPLIKQQMPQAKLLITGNHCDLPLPEAQDVTLTGYVDDVRPLLAGATVSIVPLLSGGGTRLKILEAMALRTPVVATRKGAEGLSAVAGRDLLVADEPYKFAMAVVGLLRDHVQAERIADAGYELVSAEYDWPTVIPRYLELIDQTINNHAC